MATSQKEAELEDILQNQIDLWLESLGYTADGGDAESVSLKTVLGNLLFGYTGTEVK